MRRCKLPLLTCVLALALMPIAHAATTKPTPLKLGATANIALDENDTKNYSVSLAKGT